MKNLALNFGRLLGALHFVQAERIPCLQRSKDNNPQNTESKASNPVELR